MRIGTVRRPAEVDETHWDDVDVGAEYVEIAVAGRSGVDTFTFAVDVADRAEALDRAGVEVDAVNAVDRVVGGEPGGAAEEVGALDCGPRLSTSGAVSAASSRDECRSGAARVRRTRPSSTRGVSRGRR